MSGTLSPASRVGPTTTSPNRSASRSCSLGSEPACATTAPSSRPSSKREACDWTCSPARPRSAESTPSSPRASSCSPRSSCAIPTRSCPENSCSPTCGATTSTRAATWWTSSWGISDESWARTSSKRCGAWGIDSSTRATAATDGLLRLLRRALPREPSRPSTTVRSTLPCTRSPKNAEFRLLPARSPGPTTHSSSRSTTQNRAGAPATRRGGSMPRHRHGAGGQRVDQPCRARADRGTTRPPCKAANAVSRPTVPKGASSNGTSFSWGAWGA